MSTEHKPVAWMTQGSEGCHDRVVHHTMAAAEAYAPNPGVSPDTIHPLYLHPPEQADPWGVPECGPPEGWTVDPRDPLDIIRGAWVIRVDDEDHTWLLVGPGGEPHDGRGWRPCTSTLEGWLRGALKAAEIVRDEAMRSGLRDLPGLLDKLTADCLVDALRKARVQLRQRRETGDWHDMLDAVVVAVEEELYQGEEER